MENSEEVKLISKEGNQHKVPRKAAEMSILLKNTFQDYSSDQAIPLEEVNEETLKLVIEYLNHYAGTPPTEIEKPIKSNDIKDLTDKFSADFVDALSLESLVDLTSAANYMEIQPLLDLTCAKFASMVKDKNEDEIFKTFNITTAFTEEEKQQVIKENPWLADNI